MIRWLFHDDEHRINNTGWVRNGDETEEWNEKQNHRENSERFSIYIFCIRSEAMSRICACKTEKNLRIFGWCIQFKQSCLWATLSYFCLRKQSRKINAMRRVVFPKMYKKELSVISHKIWRSLLANWVYYLAAKNHDLFVKEEWKGNWKNKENAATGQ